MTTTKTRKKKTTGKTGRKATVKGQTKTRQTKKTTGRAKTKKTTGRAKITKTTVKAGNDAAKMKAAKVEERTIKTIIKMAGRKAGVTRQEIMTKFDLTYGRASRIMIRAGLVPTDVRGRRKVYRITN